jgi:hypothetical protein
VAVRAVKVAPIPAPVRLLDPDATQTLDVVKEFRDAGPLPAARHARPPQLVTATAFSPAASRALWRDLRVLPVFRETVRVYRQPDENGRRRDKFAHLDQRRPGWEPPDEEAA